MEDIKKEQYRSLVLDLLETLFGQLTIEDLDDDDGETYQHRLYDQHGEDFADVYLGMHGNRGCKKDLTLSEEASEKLEGYAPYYRHKIFSKVLVEYVHDKLGIKCDCVQYEYDYEDKVELDSDGTEYEWRSSNTRKYNVKKKKKIKESIDKNKKFLIDVMGIDFTDKIQQITSTYDVPMEFDDVIGPELMRRYLNHYIDPIYLFELDGVKYLFQNRYDYEWFVDEEGYELVDDEILELLGIGVLGLKFSDIIDMFYNED